MVREARRAAGAYGRRRWQQEALCGAQREAAPAKAKGRARQQVRKGVPSA